MRPLALANLWCRVLKVKRTNSKMPAIEAQMKERTITAGIHKSAGKHKGSKKGLPVATIAAFNEYGTPTAPERPAFRSSFIKNRKKYKKAFGVIGKMAFNAKSTLSGMKKLGREAKSDIQKSIVSGNWVPNAESTMLKKGGGKQKINRPLIDSGQVLDSVDYELN